MVQRYDYRSFYYDQLQSEPISDDFIVPVGTELDEQLLRNLIQENEETRVPRYLRLKAAYEGKYLIFDRDKYNPKADYKPDNRLAADFATYILDNFEGYFIGIPPEVKHPDENQERWIKQYYLRNSQEEVDADLSEMVSMFGKAYEMLYQDDEGQPRSVALTPISCFIIYDNSVLKRPMYGVRYSYNEDGMLQGSFSDTNSIYHFVEDGSGLAIDGNAEAHYFGDVPMIEYVQNRQQRGVYEGTLNLMEAYNKALSEKANDVDYFADAYLAITGQEIKDDDFKKDLREYRLINVWPDDTGNAVDVQFLTKPSGDATQENLIARLEDLIYKHSMVPDISDASFGTASGIALKMRLYPMSNLARKKERKFVSAMRKRFELLSHYPNQPFSDWMDVEITMKRNMPEDMSSEASLAASLSGIVSRETQLSVLSMVDDPQSELQRIEEEQEERTAQIVGESNPSRVASTYEITSILNQRRRGDITKNVAIQMLMRIGYTREQAENLLSPENEEVISEG